MKKKKLNYELLRILACVAVIFHHVANQAALLYGNGDIKYLYLNNLTCFAVPVFLMITGFIQLQPERKFNLLKAEKKIVIPLLSFGIVFALMETVFTDRTVSLKGIGTALLNFVQGDTWTHMWYLYMLIGLYVFIPVVKAYTDRVSKRAFLSLLAILFFFQVLLPTLEDHVDFSFGVYLPVKLPYLFYCLVGYYLSKYPLSARLSAALSAGSLVLLLGWTAVEKDGFHYYTLPVALLGISLFALFTSIENVCSGLNEKALLFVSDKTFGIYIVHMVIINIVYKVLHFNPYRFFLPLGWLGVGAVTFIVSLLGVWILRKIPIVNKIFSV